MSHIREDKAVEKIAEMYAVLVAVAAHHSVGKLPAPHETDNEWELRKARAERTLLDFKEAVHDDGSSWWTTEDFTAIDAAIAS
jgi:hypothetical protein